MPPQKIDLQQSYPCVCPRKGRLNPIMLTDALGCDKCASIFTVAEDGNSLVQLDAIDPFQGCWHWDGKCWRAQRVKGGKGGLRFYTAGKIALAMALLFVILLLPIAPKLTPIVVAMMMLMVFVLFTYMLAQVRW
ncbi:MAG: hypothetical protein RMK91_01145 [Pseudanabaenaceae cyanobacterium SKYGB_i_bin29]|nr:hypothetical protein [Pseudanabaenaceae cyanobacterium SKYG29]MDW8420455.1 hypothetical protein [Pseudanabaenaceae cyanobacterium SKYGB_i_bin29]